jgi:hypothetical protein
MLERSKNLADIEQKVEGETRDFRVGEKKVHMTSM